MHSCTSFLIWLIVKISPSSCQCGFAYVQSRYIQYLVALNDWQRANLDNCFLKYTDKFNGSQEQSCKHTTVHIFFFRRYFQWESEIILKK